MDVKELSGPLRMTINGPIGNAMCKIDYKLQGKILAKCELLGLGALNRIATQRAQIGKTIRGL